LQRRLLLLRLLVELLPRLLLLLVGQLLLRLSVLVRGRRPLLIHQLMMRLSQTRSAQDPLQACSQGGQHAL
jgi:hypothetical protein